MQLLQITIAINGIIWKSGKLNLIIWITDHISIVNTLDLYNIAKHLSHVQMKSGHCTTYLDVYNNIAEAPLSDEVRIDKSTQAYLIFDIDILWTDAEMFLWWLTLHFVQNWFIWHYQCL